MSGRELPNARHTIAKAESTLRSCEQFFARQAEMMAAGDMNARVTYPPIHSAITSTLHAIIMFHDCYPGEPES